MAKGNYDAQSEALLQKFNAQAVLVIVIGGERGHGFSMSTIDPKIEREVPNMLRLVATDIEGQVTRRDEKPS